MITEERLKELIKQDATIYEAKYGNINPVDFSKNKVRWVGKYCITLEPSLVERYGNHKYYKNLFETKEEAEEYLTYGNITRTEKFPYVSWEELNKDFQEFKNGTYTIVECKYIFSLNIKVNKPAISQILLITEYENYNWNYSKENWFKALDLCVKLWKGEE